MMGNLSPGRASASFQEDLQFLTENTNFQESQIRAFYDGFRQDAASGRMSEENFGRMFRQSFTGSQQSLDKGNCFSKHMFKAFDTDNNGYIDFR